MRRDETGSIHPLMFAVTFLLVGLALLVRDLETVLVVKWGAMQNAENVAEAGAQGLDEGRYRIGEVALDRDRVARLAAAALRPGQELLDVDVDVDGDLVAVEFQDVAATPALLRVRGPGWVRPRATETARLERGVVEAEP